MTTIAFTLNGRATSVEVSPVRRLAHVLREDLGFTGTKVGCDAGDCGACTVFLDGAQVCACMVPAGQVAGRRIETVEGLAKDGKLTALQQAFHHFNAAQCGICTPGMLMAAADLFQRTARPSEDEVMDALGGVLCRCTGYRKIVDAVLHVAGRVPAAALDNTPDAGRAVGARFPKVDGLQKLDGREIFGADQAPADALWLRAVRSPHFSATFTVGACDALHRKYPGLVRVFTARDVPGNNGFGVYPQVKDQPVLADGDVRFRGEAVAALVGDRDTVMTIRDDEVPIHYTPRTALVGVDSALAEGAHRLHTDKPGNILAFGYVERGDADAALAAADVVVEGTFETAFVEHAYIEPEAGWARRVGDRVEVTVTTQTPYMDRDEVAQVLGIANEAVRIIPTACGGGFGGKLDISVQPLVALAAWHLDRPVRCVYHRIESMSSTTKRHPARMTARYGCTKDGALSGFTFFGDFNTGAYTSWGLTVKDRVPIHAMGPYHVPAVRAKTRAVFTNETPAGAFRGFGVPQAAITHEALMDEMAERIGMDPLEFRWKNAIRVGQPTASGQVLKASAGLAECLAALRPHWRKARAEAEAFNRTGDGVRRRGVGVGAIWYGCGATSAPNPSTMRMGVAADGTVTLYSGAQDIGQGTNTTMSQVAADGLGIAVDRLRLVWGDTDLTPDSGKTSASRQAYVSGGAAKRAGENLRAEILRLANAGQDAWLRFEPGAIVVEDRGRMQTIDLRRLEAGGPNGDVIMAEGYFDPPTEPLDEKGQGVPYATYGFAAQIAEVEVDVELGTVKVRRIVAAHDVGRSLNPTQVEGQIHGGVAQGLGLALMEEYIPGRTENLHDYLIPTFGDVPEIETILVEDPEPTGPYGAKGVGEHVLCATAPAIFGGIYQATGVRIRRAPATPDRVRAAILARKEQRP
ncbi:MAG: 2Fe-2S iron-sulfur cluster binding domain-containing protein [Alphaproteobacteria bacterium]|nr:2Fe-2S iron-sulfur cluster binding domain-containing protein [Alphaproteobacteria bacterium]